MNPDFETLYTKRFSVAERTVKQALWQCLVESYLQTLFGEDLTIIDIGCGFCEFINSVKGRKKYAYDIEPAFEGFAERGVEFIKAERGKSIPLPDESCDRIFASNFFEHLNSREEVQMILKDAYRILKPTGKMIAIQPNIALIGGAYWDFFDHVIPFSDKSLLEAMEMVGFKRYYIKRRFLPYTTKSSRYFRPLLLRIYLAIPLFQWVFGKQSLIVAEKRDD